MSLESGKRRCLVCPTKSPREVDSESGFPYSVFFDSQIQSLSVTRKDIPQVKDGCIRGPSRGEHGFDGGAVEGSQPGRYEEFVTLNSYNRFLDIILVCKIIEDG